MISALAAVLSLLIGVSLGLLGGGGSILTVPIFLHVLGVDPKPAIAASLVVVGTTSAVAAAVHAIRGRVRFKVGVTFGAAAMVGAYLGGLLGRFVAGPHLIIAFAAMMVVTAVMMIRGRGAAVSAEPRPLPLILAQGVGVGLMTGLIGAGGGFIIVPALVLLGGLAPKEAMATSLMVIAANCFAGLASQLNHVAIDWRVTLLVTAVAVLGSLVGVGLAEKVKEARLRQAFGWLVLAMGIFELVKSLRFGA
ncbi:MAG: sulfite exporter TauE/SafE family protein [Myxococcota bacterium]|nr:sulfite exporter TauE/SafE family protein [Myxococcota bacterium]